MQTDAAEGEEPILVSDFAKELKVSPHTIYRAINSGRLEALRIGSGRGTLRLTRSACDAYLADCRQNAAR